MPKWLTSPAQQPTSIYDRSFSLSTSPTWGLKSPNRCDHLDWPVFTTALAACKQLSANLSLAGEQAKGTQSDEAQRSGLGRGGLGDAERVEQVGAALGRVGPERAEDRRVVVDVGRVGRQR